MQYFKNSQLTELYRVHFTTVAKWIEAARAGKITLALHEQGDKTYIANTAQNIATIERLIEERKKFRNSKAAKTVSPRPEFYKLYSQAQIYDIVMNLQIHHEIPRQYNYFDGGAGNWDKYANRLYSETTPNLLNSTVELLEANQNFVDRLLRPYERVNVVDIGVGNALPVKDLLSHLLERGLLGRYVAIDISGKMLEIASRNIKEWFGGRVKFEGYELDINYDRFANILAEEYLANTSSANLVLLLGGTPCNFRSPDGAYRVIHDSMADNDYLIHTQKLDTEATRRYFDFSAEPSSTALAPNHRFIFDLLNIDESFYNVEMGFDPEQSQRYIRVRFKVSLTVKFQFEDGGERLVNFDKGDSVLLLRYWQQDALDVVHQFDRNDFHLLQTSQTNNLEYMLTVSRVKCE